MRIIFFISFLAFFSSCSEDTCSEADWLGDYVGEKIVNGVSENNYSFSIIKEEDVISQAQAFQFIFDGHRVVITDCDITGGSVTVPGTESYEGNLDGDQLTARFQLVGGVVEYTATKQ